MVDINTSKNYHFSFAWLELLTGKIITNTKTFYSYRIEKQDTEPLQLRTYIPIAGMWQDADYILAKELFGSWYVTDLKVEK